MIRKILIANRGEIAVRVIRTCKEMGIKTIAVYSDADRKSLHVRYADEAYHIGPSPSNESYLNIPKIMAVAKKANANAIHPGYGFLSENATFAEECKKAGVVFIGPSSHAIRTMGDKITARKVMIKAGVPVVPGMDLPEVTPGLPALVGEKIGYPVMVKATAGGGGKGMRLVKTPDELIHAVESAQSEAGAAFGNSLVYIEKYIESPHHIEFQVLGDNHGNVIHLYERECSVQRRHQKVIEETPSPFITNDVRIKMGEAAVAAAKAVDYSGAGTIEFLVDKNQNHYFLEMNTRLQVEHPITERVVGIDLVRAQIEVARDESLKYKQEEIKQFGHAIECRIYAEDPENNFMPSPGIIKHISEPRGLGIRIDGYTYEGFEIPLHYDPMISKLITWDKDRNGAIQRMKRALREYQVTGVKTSIGFLKRIMENEDFCSGVYDTHFIENHLEMLMKLKRKCTRTCKDMAAIAAFLEFQHINAMPKNSDSLKGKKSWKEVGRRINVNKF